MRILELEIINFGKFNHETVTFHDGMNLIYGENEMGKTTLHSFIRGMFFRLFSKKTHAFLLITHSDSHQCVQKCIPAAASMGSSYPMPAQCTLRFPAYA